MVRIVSLDYLRGAAAISVALAHFFLYHSVSSRLFEAISAVAVEVFFVLSGFVLADQVIYVASRTRAKLLAIFLVRRWMRTIPPYVVALCATSWLMSELGTGDFYRYLFYVQNLTAQNNHSDYFAVAWSLSVEEWFYVVFPLVALLGTTLLPANKRTGIIGCTVLFILVITLLRLSAGPLDDWGASVRRVVVFRIDSIAYGFGLHLLVKGGLIEKFRAVPLGLALLLSGVCSVWITLLTEDGNGVAKQLFPFAAMIFGSSAILLALSLDAAVKRSAGASKAGVLLGHFSYSIYLFHTVFLVLIMAPANSGHGLALQLAAYCMICGVFSAAFYFSFELPFLKIRPRYPPEGGRDDAGRN